MSGYFEGQSNAKVHEGDIELDKNVISQLPAGAIIKGCRGHGASNWNQTARIDIDIGGEQKSYFLKLTTGSKGRNMCHGEYESMLLIHNTVPYFAPKPLAWGTCTDPDRHFILFSFHSLQKGLPLIPRFTYAVAQLHTLSRNASPTGKFGFHITTYNGTLAQDNTWADTWEEFYLRGVERMLALEEAARGPSEELRQISQPFLKIVIPRLLRPMETGGRRIEPVLIHGDLWIGNVSVQTDTGEPMMFDASAFWGHNEYELSTMRPLENDWGNECMQIYHQHIPKSEPQEDWDARNALYALRTYMHDSALYPDAPMFRQRLIDEMRRLVEQFPQGYVEGSPRLLQ